MECLKLWRQWKIVLGREGGAARHLWLSAYTNMDAGRVELCMHNWVASQ